jgi:predicted hotdog family 3-hydroxylacyl-ACP dehydratase
MKTRPLFLGEELFKLIPQRMPIVMVDVFYDATDTEANTGLTVTADNLFCENNKLREPGLIEHVAQSAAAFAGYDTYRQGLVPKLGFIGEIKKFKIHRLPLTGECLHTHLAVLGEAAGVTLLAAETRVNDEIITSCQMKIFIKND